MLLRALLAVEDIGLRSRIGRLIETDNVLLNVLKGKDCRWEAIGESPTDVLIIGDSLVPEPKSRSMAGLTDAPNSPAIVVVWNREDPGERAELRAAGVDGVLDCRAPEEALRGALETILDDRRDMLNKVIVARRQTAQPRLSDFVSTSSAMQRFMRTVYRVVDSNAPLLIMGETGVGKERLARAIHAGSRRSEGPFISVNCGAIPENLLESELFGHKKGAFTGATKTQRGCFELAHGGTLFLDEISEMPFHLQVKLLHVLQDFEIRPIGGEKTIAVDVRALAATNRDITAEVEEKRFRQDLYYRLSVVSIRVPPLRERRSDIPTLAASFVEDLSARIGRKVRKVSPQALEAMNEYAWPGNVREMINVLERAILLCEDGQLTLADLPEEITGEARETASRGAASGTGGGFDTVPDEWLSKPLKEVREVAVMSVEKAYLTRLLQHTDGKVGETARLAGLEPRSLFTKMKRYGLHKEDFKPTR